MNHTIDALLLKAAEMNASDLHITEGGQIVVRISGVLTKLGPLFIV